MGLGNLPRLAAAVSVCAALACGDSTGTGGSGASGGAGGAPGNGGGSDGGGPGSGGTSSNGGGPSGGGGSSSSVPLTGCAAVFDGVDDLLVADVGALASTGDNFSVGAYLRPVPLSSGEVNFVAGRHLDGNNNGFYLSLAEDGGVEARLIVFAPSSTCITAAPLSLPSDGFVHVLASYSSPTARVFIDGQLAATMTCPDEAADIPSESVFTIGRSETGVFPYEGELDQLVYLPTALTSGFDPATLDCDLAELRVDFDGVSAVETSSVPEACEGVSFQVGEAAGADDADPTFVCER
ncbi:MAG: LamG domain-containing protein [Polyangiaceae bacterium]|nr:LamG domain-containing protein [Polyangiaceae bacterium]